MMNAQDQGRKDHLHDRMERHTIASIREMGDAMEPVFTLQWPELVVAEELQRLCPKQSGYSVLVPASRQEEGIDLVLLRKASGGRHGIATIQVKASRTYHLPPKRDSTIRRKHLTWFNCFEVSDYADFFILFASYPPNSGQTKAVTSSWYKSLMLLFKRDEMSKFISSCRTRSGKPDRMFGFGFDDLDSIELTRGFGSEQKRNFSDYILTKRIEFVKDKLAW